MGKPVRFAIALFSSTASAEREMRRVEQPVDVDVAIEACCMLPERFGGVNRQEKRNPVGRFIQMARNPGADAVRGKNSG